MAAAVLEAADLVLVLEPVVSIGALAGSIASIEALAGSIVSTASIAALAVVSIVLDHRTDPIVLPTVVLITAAGFVAVVATKQHSA